MGYPRKKFDAHEAKRRKQRLLSDSVTGAAGKTRSKHMTEKKKENDERVEDKKKSKATALGSTTVVMIQSEQHVAMETEKMHRKG